MARVMYNTSGKVGYQARWPVVFAFVKDDVPNDQLYHGSALRPIGKIPQLAHRIVGVLDTRDAVVKRG